MTVKPEPPHKRSRTERGCAYKVIYKRRKFAAQVASRLSRDTGDHWSAYHCDHHHGYHLGHTPARLIGC